MIYLRNTIKYIIAFNSNAIKNLEFDAPPHSHTFYSFSREIDDD